MDPEGWRQGLQVLLGKVEKRGVYWLKIDFYEFIVVQNSRSRGNYQGDRWVGVVVGRGGC